MSNVARFGNVGWDREGRVADVASNLLDAFLSPTDQYYPRSFPCQTNRACASNSTARTGDDPNLAFQTFAHDDPVLAERRWAKRVAGFNVGSNRGDAAQQTVDHAHTHLIPRRTGDIPDPRGGVRGAIPEKRCTEQQPSRSWKSGLSHSLPHVPPQIPHQSCVVQPESLHRWRTPARGMYQAR